MKLNENDLKHPLISVVIPAYNEFQGIEKVIKIISQELDCCETNWEMIVVDDGSSDQTYQKICEISRSDSRIKGIALSRNFGKEGAMLAGLESATGNAVIIMDADLQHPPSLIPEMIEKWRSGSQIIHAIKRNRNSDSTVKKTAAYCVNQLITKFSGIDINNSSDFKLLDREIVNIIICDLPEKERFLRGLTRWIGFSQQNITFDVEHRQYGGDSKWSFWSLLELSITALTSFTCAPLRIITFLGLATLLLGVLVASDALLSWVNNEAVSGYTTLIICLLLIGSFVMISLGIIGEYIAKIYEEVKARPHYLIRASVGVDHKKSPDRIKKMVTSRYPLAEAARMTSNKS